MSIDQSGLEAARWLLDQTDQLPLPGLERAAKRGRQRKAAIVTIAVVLAAGLAGAGLLLARNSARTPVPPVSGTLGTLDRLVPSYLPSAWRLNAAYDEPDLSSPFATMERLYAQGTSPHDLNAGIVVTTYRFEAGATFPGTAPTGKPWINGHPAMWFTSLGVRSVQWMYDDRTEVGVHARGLSDTQLAELASSVSLDHTDTAVAGPHLHPGDHLVAQQGAGRLAPTGSTINYMNSALEATSGVTTSAAGDDALFIARWADPHLKSLTVRGHAGIFDAFRDSPLDPPRSSGRGITITQLIWQEKPGETVAIAALDGPTLDTLLRIANSLHAVDDGTWHAIQSEACGQPVTSCPSSGMPAGEGRLTGHIGPGRPPNGGMPHSLSLTFTNGRESVASTAIDGSYQVNLPAGTWTVRSSDGNLCATGVSVIAGGTQQDDLIYPLGGCQDLSPGPPPPVPPKG